MTAKESIVQVLHQTSQRICDDCMKEAAHLKVLQVSYTVCTDLAGRGTIGRGHSTCGLCRKTKICSWADPHSQPKAVTGSTVPVQRRIDERPWFWEGNVQKTLVSWLAMRGYSIRSVADTAARAPGKDIIALSPDDRELWVSVKGYPENSPHVQARHWLAGAIFDLVLYRNERPDIELALGLPDGFVTYTSLAARVTWLRRATPFTLFWVAEDGQVREEGE
jgi:hypothetical protein